jgi:hypothetical protein
MGLEPMLRVLQFCIVDSTSENYLQAAVSPVLKCSCTASACKKFLEIQQKRPTGRNRHAASKVAGQNQSSENIVVRVLRTKQILQNYTCSSSSSQPSTSSPSSSLTSSASSVVPSRSCNRSVNSSRQRAAASKSPSRSAASKRCTRSASSCTCSSSFCTQALAR